MSIREKVIQKAIELVEASPTGKRFSELVKEISAIFPGIKVNTIYGAFHKFKMELPKSIYQPGRGLYKAVKYREKGEGQQAEGTEKADIAKIREEDYYAPFGDWLINEIEECTKFISVGGNVFKDKWGTPDVVGVWEAKRSDIFKPPTQIVSAEIKLDPTNLITAFGQACSYRLFSHKSYLVVPTSSPQEDINRLDALSRIFGIGLITFNPLDAKNPEFDIRSRAARGEPDTFYVNKYLKLVEEKLFA